MNYNELVAIPALLKCAFYNNHLVETFVSVQSIIFAS